MKKRKLKNPRKVMWAMRDFLNQASSLTYEKVYLKLDNNQFDYEIEEVPRMCKMINFNGTKQGFCAIDCFDEPTEFFEIGYNFDSLSCKGDKQFREHFVNLCPMGKGFASITLSLLHELGHFSTNQEIEGYDRELELEFLHRTIPREVRNYAYFMLPDEMAATLWAIEWLKNKENRKLAKAFEKKFFACFEK